MGFYFSKRPVDSDEGFGGVVERKIVVLDAYFLQKGGEGKCKIHMATKP